MTKCPGDQMSYTLAVSPDSVLVESMFSTAGNMLNSRSSMAPYKVDTVLFLHDNYDVLCSLLTSIGATQIAYKRFVSTLI